MTHSPFTPEERYTATAEALLRYPDVTKLSDVSQPQRGVGSSALRIHNKIFAMLVRGRLVVKLPAQRVNALIASGEGERFDPGHGRLMKEWLALAPNSNEEWLTLATEAMKFVASKN